MIFNNRNTCVATYQLLKKMNVKVSFSTVIKTIESHPYADTLLGISDSLRQWNVNNASVSLDKKDLAKMPTPFIAQLNINGEMAFTVVTETTSDKVTYYDIIHNRYKTDSTDAFLQLWTGICLLAEKSESSGESNYYQNVVQKCLTFVMPALFLLILGIGVYSLLPSKSVSLEFAYIFATMILGGALSISLLAYDVDNTNPLLHKVCSSIPKGSCTAVLGSKASHVFSWLSWSEVGFIYFAGGTILSLVCKNYDFLFFISICSSLYIVFSLVYQGFFVKQWCLLCLLVQLVLFSQGVFAIIMLNDLSFQNITAELGAICISYSLPLLLWYILKPHLLEKIQLKVQTYRYKRLKFNENIFNAILEKQNSVTAKPKYGICVGDEQSSDELIMVCNPYCGACARAHLKLEDMLKRGVALNVRIVFITPNNEQHVSYKVVKSFVSIFEKYGKESIQKALIFWYKNNSDEKCIERLLDMFPVEECKNINIGDVISDMSKWCDEMNVIHTPTFYYNGFEMPDEYDLEDLEFLTKQ
ncbi:MAG: cysteine peptidase family C39 domain-containing protein [Paludibacteraceae bacterium]|nr:cysteine peptidase family C39 domain-containing protein [Paludibacteraceae bacterium]